MPTSAKKIKLILFLAIIIAFVLLTASICAIVSIHAMRKKIETQQNEIQELKQITDYYKNKGEDDKNFDFLITVEE